MSTNKIIKITAASFYSMALIVLLVACNNENGMMHGNNSMGMNNWNSTQILTILGIVCVIGLIIWFAISRRKK